MTISVISCIVHLQKVFMCRSPKLNGFWNQARDWARISWSESTSTDPNSTIITSVRILPSWGVRYAAYTCFLNINIDIPDTFNPIQNVSVVAVTMVWSLKITAKGFSLGFWEVWLWALLKFGYGLNRCLFEDHQKINQQTWPWLTFDVTLAAIVYARRQQTKVIHEGIQIALVQCRQSSKWITRSSWCDSTL